MYGNDVRRTAIFGQYGTAVRSVRNCSENTNVYGVRPFTTLSPSNSPAENFFLTQIVEVKVCFMVGFLIHTLPPQQSQSIIIVAI